MEKVIKLYNGDPRVGELYGAILDIISERGAGISFAAVIGTLEMAKMNLYDVQIEALMNEAE